MSLKLKENHNYSLLYFAVIGLGLLTGFIYVAKIGTGVFFLSYVLLGVAQLYSGIALNKSGIAYHKRDKNPTMFYLILLPYLFIGIIGLLVFLSLP